MNSTKFHIQFFHISVLIILAAICYGGTLHFSWQFDDFPNIVANKNIHITSFSWEEIKDTIRSPFTGKISRPLSYFSFSLNYLLTGLNPVSYHLFNIAVHIISSIFVYLVFIQVLEVQHQRQEDNYAIISLRDVALLGAVLWALHPIHTQAVTYIVQRMASMAAMFYMIAFYSYLRFRRSPDRSIQILFALLTIFFWALAILSKENTVLLPLVVLASEVAFFKVSPVRHLKYFMFVLLLFAVVSLTAFVLMRGNIGNYIDYLYESRPFTMWERLITEPIILLRYLGLLLYPVADHLSLESDIIASRGFFDPPITIVSNLAVTTAIVLSLTFLRRFPLLCFGVLFYFINHLVESTFIGLELYFEHRNYLPSVFLYLVLAYYFSIACTYYLQSAKKKSMAFLFILAGTAILIGEGNATYLRNDVWQTKMSLLTEVSEKNPRNIRPLISIGVEYLKDKDYDTAMSYFKQAEELYKKNKDYYPKNWVASLYFNAAILHLKKHDYDKAMSLLHESLKCNNKSYEAHALLGSLYFRLKDYNNSRTAFVNALQLEPREPLLYNMFGRMLYADNKMELAVQVLQKGIELEPIRELNLNLIATYIKMGEMRLAKRLFYGLPYYEKSVPYLLYAACFFVDNNSFLLDKIAGLLVVTKADYCEWKNKVSENVYPGLIYPENFALIESILRKKYNYNLKNMQHELGHKIDRSSNCSILQENDVREEKTDL